MADSLLWVALLGGEIFGVIFILLFISWLLAARQKRRDRLAIKGLVARVAKDRAQRLEGWRGVLGRHYGLSGGARERAAVTMLNAELRLINQFCELYLKRKDQAAAVFDKSLYANLEAVQALEPSLRASDADDTPTSQDEGDEEPVSVEHQSSTDNPDDMAFLRTENKRLTEELRVTMETMSRMLNEYSTMFGSDGTKEVNEVMDVVEIEADESADVETEQTAEEAFDLSVEEQDVDEVAEKDEDELVAEAMASVAGEAAEVVPEEETTSDQPEAESVETLAGDVPSEDPEIQDAMLTAAGPDIGADPEDEHVQTLAAENEGSEAVDEFVLDNAADTGAVDLNDEFDNLFDSDDDAAEELDEDLFDLQAGDETEEAKGRS